MVVFLCPIVLCRRRPCDVLNALVQQCLKEVIFSDVNAELEQAVRPNPYKPEEEE
jgi:hypothetical protein